MPDRTLVVAETLGARLTAFDVSRDGSVTGRRTWADLSAASLDGGAVSPDGLSMAGGASVWVADPHNSAAVRVAQGGRVLERVQASQPCFSVATLPGGGVLCCTAATSKSDEAAARNTGRLEFFDARN